MTSLVLAHTEIEMWRNLVKRLIILNNEQKQTLISERKNKQNRITQGKSAVPVTLKHDSICRVCYRLNKQYLTSVFTEIDDQEEDLASGESATETSEDYDERVFAGGYSG